MNAVKRADTRSFGQTFRLARKACCYSQRYLALRAGVSPTYISRLESGAVLPSDRVLDVMTAYLPSVTRDEWHRLAGRLAPELRDLLYRPGMVAFIRSTAFLTEDQILDLAARIDRGDFK